jgi:(p)ppGpp synthase/HD superfamily hydrolase
MLYTPLTKKALRICFDAHKEQTDKSGLPYVFHPLAVAAQMQTEAEICTALLHDVAEDSPVTLDDLARDFPPAVIRALELLTHRDGVPYTDYVRAIRTNRIAAKVKLADLRHNSDLSRLDTVTSEDLARVEKYKAAIKILTE